MFQPLFYNFDSSSEKKILKQTKNKVGK